MKHQHLVLGGARSGKSRFAESVINLHCQEQHLQKIYVATATASDDEMKNRIKRHQNDRDEKWTLIEEPLNLASIIKQAKIDDCLLIECLTLWLSNCLYHNVWPEQKTAFLDTLKTSTSTIVMVSNEVGQGIIPANALSRQFIDESGWLHQELASICNKVSFVTAGIPQTLKDTTR